MCFRGGGLHVLHRCQRQAEEKSETAGGRVLGVCDGGRVLRVCYETSLNSRPHWRGMEEEEEEEEKEEKQLQLWKYSACGEDTAQG